MNETWMTGVGAGLGVALPLGAIGLLLVQHSMRDWRSGAAAACAIALVDLAYAAVAVTVGSTVQGLLTATAQTWVRLASAAILMVIAIRGLLALRHAAFTPVSAPAAAAPDLRRSFVRFAALTAINPLTALYFTALAAARPHTPGAAAGQGAFLGGVFTGSLLWQLILVALGALVGARLSHRARMWTHILGHGMIGVFALHLAWPG
ncbi:LysE family transporter [Streptomyces sp. NPDC096311]|uniref:LysE family transporter n=1 Tax=Streptomyces sp. NPDC096311 TaxID=3366083 RepID=UPI00380E9682